MQNKKYFMVEKSKPQIFDDPANIFNQENTLEKNEGS